MALSVGGIDGVGYATERPDEEAHHHAGRGAHPGVAMTVIAFLPPLPLILALRTVVGSSTAPSRPIYNWLSA